jgi:hypothetical protein
VRREEAEKREERGRGDGERGKRSEEGTRTKKETRQRRASQGNREDTERDRGFVKEKTANRTFFCLSRSLSSLFLPLLTSAFFSIRRLISLRAMAAVVAAELSGTC